MDVSMKRVSMGTRKKIALVAHDNRKKEMVLWAKTNRKWLENHTLCGTGTTASLLSEELNLPVQAYYSGPFGGDQQIGAEISEGHIHCLIFFWDPLSAQPHDPDVKALLRISVLYNIPVANNSTTADFLLTSPYMAGEYVKTMVDYQGMMEQRVKRFEEEL